jgi:hypothetical protein
MGIHGPSCWSVESVHLSGQVRSIRTLAGNEPASCDLLFTSEERLDRFDCTVDDFGTGDAHQRAEDGMVQEIRSGLGEPTSSTSEAPVNFGQTDRTWTWQSPTAHLEVSSRFADYGSVGLTMTDSNLVVRAWTNAHDDEVARVRDANARRCREAEAAERRLADERREQERQRLLQGSDH